MAEPAEHELVTPTDPLRGPRRLLVWGSGGALLLAFGSSALGATGDVGLVLLLLLLALVFALTGLWIAARLLRDQFRGRPTERRHWGFAVGLSVAALLCMTASAGLSNTLGAGT